MDQRIQGKNFNSILALFFWEGGDFFSEKILNLVLKFIKIV